MTQEDKELLLKDLCARLPYGIFVRVEGERYFNEVKDPYPTKLSLGDYLLEDENVTLLPYLRPMSSMTKEEKYIYRHMLGAQLNSEGESIMFVYIEDFPAVIDWLNAHHFDYRGLIEKGLALEAEDGMYKID